MKFREKNILSKVNPEFREKLYLGCKLKNKPKVYKIKRQEKILIIPEDIVGFVIGKNGSFIKNVSAKYTVKISVNKDNQLIVYSKDYQVKQIVRNEFVKKINSFHGNRKPIRYTTINTVYDKVVYQKD